jgi:membrane protease YdiL (CAAX protease family)
LFLPPWLPLCAALAFTAASLRLPDPQPLHFSLFALALVWTPLLLPGRFHVWPFRLLAPLAAYGLVVLAFPRLRMSAAWLKAGHVSRSLLLAGLLVTAASAGGLLAWVALARPDMRFYASQLPDLSLWPLAAVGLGFSVLNGAMEEAAFRGVTMQALEKALGPGVFALCAQAAVFGIMHFQRGFPNGAAGAALAAVFGFMLGLLRRSSGGMLLPWAVHTGADAVIFAIVAVWVHGGG